VLARLHKVDPVKVGLADYGRTGQYIARQLARWTKQYAELKTEHIEAMEKLSAWLPENIPTEDPTTIAHGDYRFGNCITDVEQARIAAVLDWELCTLGDVLADLAQLLVYWGEPGDEHFALDSPPSAEPGFSTRAELVARYATRSKRDLSQLDFYMAFASWKVACILEGVYSRYVAGAMGDRAAGQDISTFIRRVDHLSSQAAAIARTL